MANVAFLLAFLAIPVAAYLLVRSVTWVALAFGVAFAFFGAAIAFTIDRGFAWTWLGMQAMALAAMLAVLIWALLVRSRHGSRYAVPFRQSFLAVMLPALVGVLFLVIARVLAAPSAGMFTAVGFLVRRQSAEDNAKWLDFTAQLAQGGQIVEAVPLGGPLALLVTMLATALAVVSLIAFGGVNEVFVAANSVVYAEYLLALLAPLALAPIAERRFRMRESSAFIPVPMVWAGAFVLVTASLAVSGLGHLTLQFTFLVAVFWAAIFMVGTKVPYARFLTSLTFVAAGLVWFPLIPMGVIVLIGVLALLIRGVARGAIDGRRAVAGFVATGVLVVLMWHSLFGTLTYIADIPQAAGVIGGFAAGGISAVAVRVPALQLLSSQGGTEVVTPIIAILTVISVILAVMFIQQRHRRSHVLMAFAPLLLLIAVGLGLSILGTWYAGVGPAYGALKTTFLATFTGLAVTLPIALLELQRRRFVTTAVQWVAIGGVVFILAVDGILPRAMIYISPAQWPNAAAEVGNYWWPAEVQSVADQSIASNPVACAYQYVRTEPPTALPLGQTAYSCTRLLVGLSGLGGPAQPLVSWQLREWLSGIPAWYDVYPGFIELPEDIRRKNMILLDDNNRVIGLGTVQSFLDRFKPEWAQ